MQIGKYGNWLWFSISVAPSSSTDVIIQAIHALPCHCKCNQLCLLIELEWPSDLGTLSMEMGSGKWERTMDTQKGTGEEHTQAKVKKCCSSLKDWIGASQTQKTSLYKGIFRGPSLFVLCSFKESIFTELRLWRLCAHQVLLCSIQSTALRLYKTWVVVNEDRGMQRHHFVN